jgi:hypothetical protein
LQKRRWRWRSFFLKGISCKNKVIIFRFFSIVLFYYVLRFCKWLLCYCSSYFLFMKDYKCNNDWVWGCLPLGILFLWNCISTLCHSNCFSQKLPFHKRW